MYMVLLISIKTILQLLNIVLTCLINLQAGALSAFPYAILLMTLLGGGFLADYLISRTKLARTVIRKLMTSLGKVMVTSNTTRIYTIQPS